MTVHSYITWENRTVPIMKGILSCLLILSACKCGRNCVTKSNTFHCTCTYQLAGIHGEGLQRYCQHLLHSLWSCLERDRNRKKAPSLCTEGYTNCHQRETLTLVATKTVSTSVTLYIWYIVVLNRRWGQHLHSLNRCKASSWVTPVRQRPRMRLIVAMWCLMLLALQSSN